MRHSLYSGMVQKMKITNKMEELGLKNHGHGGGNAELQRLYSIFSDRNKVMDVGENS